MFKTNAEAISILIDDLASPLTGKRYDAIRSLGGTVITARSSRCDEVIRKLRALQEEDPDRFVRSAAESAISRIQEPELWPQDDYERSYAL